MCEPDRTRARRIEVAVAADHGRDRLGAEPIRGDGAITAACLEPFLKHDLGPSSSDTPAGFQRSRHGSRLRVRALARTRRVRRTSLPRTSSRMNRDVRALKQACFVFHAVPTVFT